jgi:hypothetical protein
MHRCIFVSGRHDDRIPVSTYTHNKLCYIFTFSDYITSSLSVFMISSGTKHFL